MLRLGSMTDTDVSNLSRTNNSLLVKVSDAEWERLRPHLHSVELGTGQILYRRHDRLDYVYFPRRGCVSLVIEFMDGFQAEAGLVGSEGMIGLPLIYGIKTDIVAAVVQAPSEALRMTAAHFSRELEHLPNFERQLLRYGEAMRAQAMQLAACNGHHGLDARLARCILTLQDRSRTSELPVTHELLAGLLCAHRPSISVAAKRLQHAGLIRYSTGQLIIADRAGLENATCECYQVIRDHMQVVTGHP
jgi:CRP-like cAMP-binding protein